MNADDLSSMSGIAKWWLEQEAEELEKKRCEAVRVARAEMLYDWYLKISEGGDEKFLRAMRIRP